MARFDMPHFEFPDTDLDPRPVMTSARRRPEAGCSWDSFRSVKRRKNTMQMKIYYLRQ